MKSVKPKLHNVLKTPVHLEIPGMWSICQGKQSSREPAYMCYRQEGPIKIELIPDVSHMPDMELGFNGFAVKISCLYLLYVHYPLLDCECFYILEVFKFLFYKVSQLSMS